MPLHLNQNHDDDDDDDDHDDDEYTEFFQHTSASSNSIKANPLCFSETRIQEVLMVIFLYNLYLLQWQWLYVLQ